MIRMRNVVHAQRSTCAAREILTSITTSCLERVMASEVEPSERLTDYGARIKGTHDSSIVGSLTAFEKKLVENQDVKTTGGKLHQGTPELIPEMAKVGMKTVADPEIRKNLGLNRDGPFLFAIRDLTKSEEAAEGNLEEPMEETELHELLTCSETLYEPDTSLDEPVSQVKKLNSAVTRQKWTKEEEEKIHGRLYAMCGLKEIL